MRMSLQEVWLRPLNEEEGLVVGGVVGVVEAESGEHAVQLQVC